MKKLLKMLTVFLLMALLFAACGGDENPGTTQPTETTTEGGAVNE